VISVDSLTVLAMTAVLALGTRRAERRPARIAMGGLTGLFAALWLAEFASAVAGGVVAVVSLVVLIVGLAGLAAGRLRREASTRPARRRPPRRARGRR
jgi:ABC-type uncharacterized transport system permease subunit